MNDIIEIEGKKYVDVKTAAELWKVTPETVRNYCKTGKVIGEVRFEKNRWYIQVDAKKPFKKSQIKNLLFLVSQLKNNPDLEIDWDAVGLEKETVYGVYKSLEALDYIKHFDKNKQSQNSEIPYIVELTEMGTQLVDTQTKNKRTKKSDWISFIVTITPSIIKIGELILTVITRK